MSDTVERKTVPLHMPLRASQYGCCTITLDCPRMLRQLLSS